jgi:NADH:ubiquinone oxidoreductase subunit 3 (subunit A)
LDGTTSPIIVFFAAIIVTAIIYGIGGKISPKPDVNEDKVTSYACGEDLPPVKARVSMYLYNYASLFLILDVIAMVIALSMGVTFQRHPFTLFVILIYLVIATISAVLIFRRGELRHL